MKKYSMMAVLVAAAAMTIVSCKEKNYDSYPPTWNGFAFYRDGVKISTTNIYGGDRLTVRAQQNKKGHLINSTYYYWNLTYLIDSLGTDNVHYYPEHKRDTVIHTNYDGTSNADPEWVFQLPGNALGAAVLSFEAKYNYSGSGIQVNSGGDYTQSAGTSGSISSQSGSMSGGAKGAVRFNIKEKQ